MSRPGPIERAIRAAIEMGDRRPLTSALAACAGIEIGELAPEPIPPAELALLRRRIEERPDVVLELELELTRVVQWGDRWFLALCKAAERPGYSERRFARLLAHYRGNTEASRVLRAGLDACYKLRAYRASKVRS